jgi:hypothetical protein
MYSKIFLSFTILIMAMLSPDKNLVTTVSLLTSIVSLIVTITTVIIKVSSENIGEYDMTVVSNKALLQSNGSSTRGGNTTAAKADTGDNGINAESSELLRSTIQRLEDDCSDVRMSQVRESIALLRDQHRSSLARQQQQTAIPSVGDVEEPHQSTMHTMHIAQNSIDVLNDSGNSVHTCSTSHADSHLEVLRQQLQLAGIRPLEYIPLGEIKTELAEMMVRVNAGESFDEARLDHLLQCMEINQEYIAEKKVELLRWREKIASFAQR